MSVFLVYWFSRSVCFQASCLVELILDKTFEIISNFSPSSPTCEYLFASALFVQQSIFFFIQHTSFLYYFSIHCIWRSACRAPYFVLQHSSSFSVLVLHCPVTLTCCELLMCNWAGPCPTSHCCSSPSSQLFLSFSTSASSLPCQITEKTLLNSELYHLSINLDEQSIKVPFHEK